MRWSSPRAGRIRRLLVDLDLERDGHATTTTADLDKPQPIAEYLSSLGVTGEQVPLDKLTDLTVTLPRPPGWTKYANPNFSPGTEAIAKNNTYPTAMVMVFKLTATSTWPKHSSTPTTTPS